MQVVSFPARQLRTHYRHELRTLTYVTLDDANGGIVRNLNHEGVAIQAVAALRPQQLVRLRFELRFPRLRVETRGQVSWANRSGQCGIRFIDLPARTRLHINEWIFSNLLDAIVRDATHPRPIFGRSAVSIVSEENVPEEIVRDQNASEKDSPDKNDGLILSPAPRPAIRLAPNVKAPSVIAPNVIAPNFVAPEQKPILPEPRAEDRLDPALDAQAGLSWLSRPVSGRTLAGLVDGLVILAAMLLFALIFLSIAHELPRWPLALGAASAAAVFIVATYRTLYAILGGPSLGARLAEAASNGEEKEERENASRFR